MAEGIDELIGMLYEMVQDAWSLPLGSDKCVLERDKVLDLLDEINAQFPAEIAEAKKLVTARNDYIAAAKREADMIIKQAEEQARRLVSSEEVLMSAKKKSQGIVTNAEARSKELRIAANEYVEDLLKRTEDAISEALGEMRRSRSKFRSVSGERSAQDSKEEKVQ